MKEIIEKNRLRLIPINWTLVLLSGGVFLSGCRIGFCPDDAEFSGKGRVSNGVESCEIEDSEGHKIKTGPYVAWHTIERMKQRGYYRNGKKHGRWTEWYPNGVKKEQTHMRNGLNHGLTRSWYSNRKQHVKGRFENGVMVGKWMEWYDTGKVSQITEYKKGIKHGSWSRYHPNGLKAESGWYKEGIRKGTWQVWDDKGKEIKRVEYNYPENLNNNPKSAPIMSTPPPEGHNLLLIVVSALRADVLIPYGYAKPTTPTLSKLAGEGILFETVHAASPWSLPAVASLVTGLSPTAHGAGWPIKGRSDDGDKEVAFVEDIRVTPLSKQIATVPDLLGANQIVTGAIINDPDLHPDVGLRTHFQHYDIVVAPTPTGKDTRVHRAPHVTSRPADETTKAALEWLDREKQNQFFLLLNYSDPHNPYAPPTLYAEQFATIAEDRYRRSFSNINPIRKDHRLPDEIHKQQIRGLYDGEVRFTDDQIGVLIDGMKKMGLLENTWIMVTSAHGEEIFDHNSIDHGHRYEEEVIRVPLIIRAPGGKWNAGVRLATSVRHIDVAPTIMALFGVSPQETFEGESLMPVIKGEQKTHRPALAESNIHWFKRYAWIDGRYKLIKPVQHLPGVLFDLQKDPGERMEISPPHPIYKSLLKASEDYINRLNQRNKRDPGSSEKHVTQPPKKPHPSSSSKGSSPE